MTLASDRLGISELSDSQYEAMRVIQGHRYETPPGIGFGSKEANQRFLRLAGSMNPKFNPELFDHTRERLQVMEKKERQQMMEALGVLYAQRCSEAFVNDPKVDHAEFERMLLPTYAPPYASAARALDLPRKMWWKSISFEALENISRIPLSQCDIDGNMEMSFEEWYQLFWNYAMPFNPVAYYCLATSQQMVFTREFVAELAEYLRSRLDGDFKVADGGSAASPDAPVLLYGARVGKLAALLNATKRVPVAVVAASEKPTRNPYLLQIPPQCQEKFRPAPIEKLKLETAMDKYQPSIVLLAELNTQQDITQDVRKYGSVREYLTLGMPDSMVEGHGWETFGRLRFRADAKRGDTTLAPYMQDGFKKFLLPNVSRWAIHRYDQRMAMGLGGVVSFHRAATTFDIRRRGQWFARRLQTFF